MSRGWQAFVLGLAGVATTVTLTGAALALAGSGLSTPAKALDMNAPPLAAPDSRDPRPADKHSARTPGAAPSRASTDVLNGPSGSKAPGGDSLSGDASAPSTPGTDTGDADGGEPHDEESNGSDDTDPEDHGDD